VTLLVRVCGGERKRNRCDDEPGGGNEVRSVVWEL
jgi:hypothetical protein